MKNNRSILIAITIVLIGIFAVMAMNYTNKADNNTLGGSIDEVVEEVGDEIDDHTTSR